MPSPDTLATIAAVAAVLLLALAVRFTAPGGLYRIPVIVRGIRYHHANRGRHAMRAIEPTPMSALETVPDPVSPFAARTT